jgi:hypothetical protein
LQHVVARRIIARLAVEHGERYLARATGLGQDHGIERQQRHGHVSGIGGDAGVAGAEHGMDAVEPIARGATEPASRLLQACVVS